MRILQVSDLHGNVRAAERTARVAEEGGYDLVFVVGDITNFGTVQEAASILQKVSGGGVPVYFVAGNCDPPALLNYETGSERVVNVSGRQYRYADYDLFGVGGSGETPSRATWIEFTEDELRGLLRKFRSIPGRGTVLISHSPPHDVKCDEVGGRHIGSKAVREFVESHPELLLVSCGHVHEARSIDRLGNALIVNAGPAKDGYCASITIDDREIRAELKRLFP
ncbi:MAG: metallophosphoesterase family protein [Aigarchaeota archaeon]|nr:metallophosphoesterase family protein [Aigarchaeota archaeon]MDW8093129.1 metallophosphoesterase family protein [Nitrososphaerota archaeon]